MKSLFRLLLKTQLKRNAGPPDKINSGMTMLELLVGTIMAFLIITPMLTFVVDMLNTDRREQVKANTEQDVQAAASFIAQDLSQAVRIYNQPEIQIIANNQVISVPSSSTPILVFWKREIVKDVIPVKVCTPNANNDCLDDTNVMSLVTYYVRRDNNPTWCTDGADVSKCPARIERLAITDGVKDPEDDTKYLQKPDSGFNPQFNIKDPTKLQKAASSITKNPEVLVNYLDHSPLATTANECQQALGNPQDADGKDIDESVLKVANNYAGFYACVDSSRTLAQVFIRGNALRRIQNDALYSDNKSAFFPKASFQVKGLSGLGQ